MGMTDLVRERNTTIPVESFSSKTSQVRARLLRGERVRPDETIKRVDISNALTYLRDRGFQHTVEGEGPERTYWLRNPDAQPIAPTTKKRVRKNPKAKKPKRTKAVQAASDTLRLPRLGESVTVFLLRDDDDSGKVQLGLANGDTRWVTTLEGISPK